MRFGWHWLGLLCASVLAVGCGDDDGDGGGGADASNDQIDGSTLEITQRGTFLVLETSYQPVPEMGDGAFLVGKIQDIEDEVPYSFEVAPGAPFDCKVRELNPTQATDAGEDIGTVAITIDEGPAFPPCHLIPGVGWGCPAATGTGGDIANVDGDTWSITDEQAGFTADDVGRIVNITGAAEGNNGLFPITMVAGDTIHFLNPNGAEDLGTAGAYTTLAGMGPAGQTDTIDDTDTLTFQVTAGGTGKFEDFSKTVPFGDHFTLDDASAALLSDVPMDGSAFTISCAGEGGECNAATATALDIVTTDGDIAGLPPFVMPPPATKSVQILCILLVPDADVSEEVSQYIADSGATRVRTIYTRAETQDEIQDEAQVTIVAGHALMGFTDP